MDGFSVILSKPDDKVIRAQRWGGIPTCLNEDTRMEPVVN